MSLEEIQSQVDEWAQQFETPYWPPEWIINRLIEEAGEVAREVQHLYGPKKKKETEAEGDLGQEIVDVIFTVTCMANREGINLQKEWERMMQDKHYGRDKERYTRK